MKNISLAITAALLFLCLSIPATAMGQDFMEGVDIHGFISQGFIYSDEYNYLSNKSTDGSFEYDEMGINFGKQLTPKLGIGLQFFARDIGDAANNKVTLDWAYGDYRFQDWLGARFGKIKLPLGLWSEIRDYDMLRPWIVLPQNTAYYDLNRDSLIAANGLGLYGNLALGTAGSADYYLVCGNSNSDRASGLSKYISNQFSGLLEFRDDVRADMVYAGNLRWSTPVSGLMVGIWAFASDVKLPMQFAGGGAPVDIKINNTYTGAMLEYVWENVSLWAEYISQDTEFKGLGQNTDIRPEAYYLGAAYQFALWFQLGAYYSEAYIDGDDKDGSDQEANGFYDHRGWEKDLALTLRFDINEYWVFKVEGHMVDGTQNVLAADNPDSDLSEQNFYYGVAKLSVSF